MGDDIVIDIEMVPSPHDVTGLIKSFFRELGEPLLSDELYPDFMRTKSKLSKKKLLLLSTPSNAL